MKKMTLFLLASGFLLVAAQGWAQIPVRINFQGKLTDTKQVPINATSSMAFSIYSEKTAGILLW